MIENKKDLQPITVCDCMDYPALPNVHDVRVDLYYCARGLCSECSRKSEKNCRKSEVGGCKFGLLEDANELLRLYEIEKKRSIDRWRDEDE